MRSKYLYKVLASGPVQDHRNGKMNEHLHQKEGGVRGGGGAVMGVVLVLLIRTVFSVNTVTTDLIAKVGAPVQVCGRGGVATSDGGGGCKMEAAVHQSAPPHR